MHKRTGFVIGTLLVLESDEPNLSVEIEIEGEQDNPYSGGSQALDIEDVENLIRFLRATVRKQKARGESA